MTREADSRVKLRSFALEANCFMPNQSSCESWYKESAPELYKLLGGQQ